MSIKTLMSVEEYLRTSFEEGDRDYLDGEIEERNLGERGHSLVQILLGHRFVEMRRSHRLEALTEIRIQIDERRHRVADIAVWPVSLHGLGIPAVPPSLVIEILSPEDRIDRMRAHIDDYLRVGVRTVWLIDPVQRTAKVYTAAQPDGAAVVILRTADLAVEIPLADVLPLEDNINE